MRGGLRRALDRAAASPVLLVATDFDGTLSPIVPEPAAAAPEPEALAELVRLGGLPDTHAAILSGRSRTDLAGRTGSPAGVILIGSHGAEWEEGVHLPPQRAETAARITDMLRAIAGRFPGAEVEPKPAGAAFHYRHVSSDGVAEALRGVEEGPGAAPGVRMLRGKKVLELSVAAADKGDALGRLRRELGPEAVVFLGDDVTDEHGFAALGPDDVGIKIGPGETAATYRLDDRLRVKGVLRTLADLRKALRGVFLVLAWLAAGAAPAHAQSDPVQEAPAAWSGFADLGFTLTQGNSETSSVALGVQLKHERPHHRVTLTGALLRATAEGEETANRGSGTLQYDFLPDSAFFLFAKLATGFNEPAGLELRLAPGLGVGYTIVATERVRLSLEGGGNVIRDSFANDSTSTGFFGSLGETFAYTLNERTSVLQAFTFAPRPADLGDYLLHAEGTLTTMLVESLGLEVSLVSDYDSTPFIDPETGLAREKNDLTFITGLTYKF